MGGISVLLMMLIMLVLVIAFIMVGIMAVVMFVAATILTIVCVVKKEERKASGKQLGAKVAIPVTLYLVSIPILIFMVSIIFSCVLTNNKSDNTKYYDRYNQNNSIYHDYDDVDYIYDTICP